MALTGTLGDFSLTDVLQLIGLQRKSGVLYLHRGEEQVSIGFDSGRVVSAESNRRPAEFKVGQLLVRTGKLTEERLNEALRRQQATLQRLGHVLVESNWVDKETVRRQLLLQITETIYDLFRWKDGEYDFRPEARVEWDRGYIDPIPSENLLMEGARMIDEWPLVERVIPSRAVVLGLTSRGASILATAPDAQEARGSVYDQDIDFGVIPSDPLGEPGAPRRRFTDRERAVLRWVDGRRPAGEIAELSGLGTFEGFHLMADLVEAGLLELVETAEGGAKPKTALLLRLAAPAKALAAAVATLAVLGSLAAVQEAVRAVAPGARPIPAATFIGSADALSGVAGLEQLRRAVSGARMARLEAALTAHMFSQGAWPRTLDDLAERGFASRADLEDPWGDRYSYEATAVGWRLAESSGHGRAPLVRERPGSSAPAVP